VQTTKDWRVFARLVDDISCLAFTVAVTVTVMFWALHFATGGMVERSGARPPWLGFSVHIANSIFAAGDITLSVPRTFSKRSFQLVALFAVSYATWLALCRCVRTLGGDPAAPASCCVLSRLGIASQVTS
jgi:FAR-17a/AIG1-like protein